MEGAQIFEGEIGVKCSYIDLTIAHLFLKFYWEGSGTGSGQGHPLTAHGLLYGTGTWLNSTL